jgi:site-specific DNA-methyltransferase (adenine-specific)
MMQANWQTKEILNLSRLLAKSVPALSATKLPPVKDLYSRALIPSWRNCNPKPELPLHGMVSRVGGFPPALARYFLAAYTKPGDVVLDPFCGKGTALLEAARLGRIAVGGDIAPDAVAITKAKMKRLPIADVVNYIEALDSSATASFKYHVPPHVSLFFNHKTLAELLAARSKLFADIQRGNAKNVAIARFVIGTLLGLLHGHSRISLSLPCNQCFAMSPNYVRRYIATHRLQKPYRNVKKCLLARVIQLLPAPNKMAKAHVYEAPAEACNRYLRRFRPKAKLILTSPPYLDKQTYARDAWLRLWFLGRDSKEFSFQSLETGSVRRFVEGMTRSFRSMWDALDQAGTLVMVCGHAKRNKRNRDPQFIRIADLCLLAASLSGKPGARFLPRKIIHDRILMKRGSYFAVHHGKAQSSKGSLSSRYSEDQILVFSKPAPGSR